MIRRFSTVLLGACSVLVATGCSLLDSPVGRDAVAAPIVASSTASSTASGTSGMGSAKEGGNLPDPCDLLSDFEVKSLTGRGISQQDVDDAPADAAVRYCQWQQPGGQLALFVSRTTHSDFNTVIADATPVAGVGQDAFELAGHLYVLYGTVQLDVYSRGDSDEENLAKAKRIAEVVLPRI